jgi:hypothetical protein
LISQTDIPLSKQLWNIVHCYETVKNAGGEPSIIDDSKNGYIQVSGSWPTCGCGCSSTVGAYKKINGDYVFLIADESYCDSQESFSSDRPFDSIMPNNFGIQTFIENFKSHEDDTLAIFYLKVNIPQKGTETIVSINLVPFGLNQKNQGILSYEISQNRFSNYNYEIINFVSNLKNETTLDLIMTGDYSKISKNDFKELQSCIGEDHNFLTIDQIRAYFKKLYYCYKLYESLRFINITFDFDRTSGHFYIKSTSGKPEKYDFKTFLIKNKYWSPSC